MPKITREFKPADRYVYDFGPCSAAKGFSQIDTEQDAWYYGQWANPTTFVIFSYCEGDCTTTQCENAEEFTAQMLKIEAWSKDHGYTCKIDDGRTDRDAVLATWTPLGLAHMLH